MAKKSEITEQVETTEQVSENIDTIVTVDDTVVLNLQEQVKDLTDQNTTLLNTIEQLKNDRIELETNWGNQVEELQAHINKLEKHNVDLVFELQAKPEPTDNHSNVDFIFPVKSWVNVPKKYNNMRFQVRQHAGVSAGEPIYRLYQYETEQELTNIPQSEITLARNIFKQ